MNSIVSEKRFISQTLGVPYENLSQSYLRSETELTTTSVIDFTLQTNKKQGSLVTERLLDLNDEFVITHFTVGLKQISAAAPTVQQQLVAPVLTYDNKTAFAGTNGANVSAVNGQLNKTYISKKVFSDTRALKTLNSIVHPAVKSDFNLWCTTQKGPYIIKEAAILFESKSNIGLDKVILVSSPKELKISRVLKRDQTDEQSVLERMDAQWKDSEKRLLADYEIRKTKKLVSELTQSF